MAQRKGLHLILEILFIYNLVQRIFEHKPTSLPFKFRGLICVIQGVSPIEIGG